MSHHDPDHKDRPGGDERDGFETPDLDGVLGENQDPTDLFDSDDRPEVPVGVLDGINALARGDTADVDDLEAAMKD